MSDPGNLGFLTLGSTSSIWLYTHWEGANLPTLARLAITAAQPRWGDPAYATRIALAAVAADYTAPDGWGVDTEPGENEHRALLIDWEDRTITLLPDDLTDSWGELSVNARIMGLAFAPVATFAEYLALAPDPVTEAWS